MLKSRQRITVLLIAPSKYDDQGFVHRYLKGVITTSSLCTVSSLTEQALQSILSSRDKARVKSFEEIICFQALSLVCTYAIWLLASYWHRLWGIQSKLIVGLVGVQSHQFPRAIDLIKRWQKRGATCVIGGPHITGSITAMLDGLGNRGEGEIPCPHTMPPEIQALQKRGTIIFHGEAEPHPNGTNAWQKALRDIISGQPQTLYRGGRPDITQTPLPELRGSAIKYFSGRLVPLNEARGCPFACKFCSVVTMQGRAMRCRSPHIVVDYFRMLCQRYGRASVFVTGDNFVRNKYKDTILAGLAQLRQQGKRITFMIQADIAACLNDSTLIPRLAAAGCNMIFFGIETLNQAGLKSAGKKHNLGQDLPKLWEQCHKHNLIVHAAYMIGFPPDTKASVLREVDQLHQYGADHVSFYIRGPIPGCEDWIRLICAGEYIDPDINNYDSHRCITAQGLQMSSQECEATYQEAWRQFYRLPNMINALKRFPNRATRWRLSLVHLWYWWAIHVEKTHPMIAGFYRIRPYWDRRPDAPSLPFWLYCCQEIWRHMRYLGYWLAGFYLWQQLLLEVDYQFSDKKAVIADKLSSFQSWFKLTFGPTMHRRWLNEFWLRYARKRWQLLNPIIGVWWHIKMIPYAFAEVIYTIRWALMFRRIIRTIYS